jgi:hypothetical protein
VRCEEPIVDAAPSGPGHIHPDNRFKGICSACKAKEMAVAAEIGRPSPLPTTAPPEPSRSGPDPDLQPEGGPAGFRQDQERKHLFTRRSRRSGAISVRDHSEHLILRLGPGELDAKLDELSSRPLSSEGCQLFDALMAFSIEECRPGKKPRGIHAKSGRPSRLSTVERVKLASAIAYLWVRKQKKNPDGDRRLQRLRMWVKGRKSEWSRWTEPERDYATAAAMVTRAFDFGRLGLLNPLRPFQAGASAPRAFYVTYIQPRLSRTRAIAKRFPALLSDIQFQPTGKHGMDDLEAGGTVIRSLLSACEAIVTL